MNELEEKVLAKISREKIVSLTKCLVSIDTQNPPVDYSVSSKMMEGLYKDIGLETRIFCGQEGKPNVGGRWLGSGECKKVLLLSGHMDVVPAGTGWEIPDPLSAQERGGYLIGRGTADMKGSLAAQYIAVKALKEAGVKLKGSLYLFATVDDETAGKMGLRYVIGEGLEKAGWAKPDFHILGEPTDLTLCVAFKGRMWLKITLNGKPAHGGNPKAGINAIEKMVKLMDGILKLERKEHPLMGEDTINIGTISGGTKTNVVPGSCTLTLDYRYVAPETSADIERKLRRLIEEAAAADKDLSLAEFEIFERREPLEVAQDLPQMQALKEITGEVTGKIPDFGGVLSAGDAYWTITSGIPAVFFGPGSMSVAHTNRECVRIEELENAAKIFALYILRTLG